MPPSDPKKSRSYGSTRMVNVGDLLARLHDLSEEYGRLEDQGRQLQALRAQLDEHCVAPLRAQLALRHPAAQAEAGLWVIQGAQKDEVFPIPPRQMVLLGREDQATFVIRDPEVSRAHCKLVQTDPWTFRIKDLGSQNGTLLNGEGIREAQLQGGDVLVLGMTWLVFSHSAIQLAADLEDPQLWAASCLVDALALENRIFEVQMHLSGLERSRRLLAHARSENLPEARRDALEDAFRDLYDKLSPQIEAELKQTRTQLQLLCDKLPPPASQAPARAVAPPPLPADEPDDPADRIQRLKQENYELRNHALESERRLRLAIGELLAEAELHHGRGETRHAQNLLRRILAIDPLNRAARDLATRVSE